MTTTIDKTLRYEEHSAEFWSQNLGLWSAKMRARADAFAIGAAILSAMTGGAVWTTLSDSTQIWAQVGVTAMAVAAAVAASVPKLRGYGDCAAQAADLAGRYGADLVALRFAHEHRRAHAAGADDEVKAAIDGFLKTRADKQKLSPYPKRLEETVMAEYEKLGIERRQG